MAEEERARIRAPWLQAPESRRVLRALAAGGRPARFVGGCVRDALARPGEDAVDLDLATPEPPERATALLEAAGVRVVPTGLRHGTVTALPGCRRYEVTTLRRDVACFGRHAEVEFTDDFDQDAARRDFTINAMSCDADGRLHDPFGGQADLEAGRVRFVGDARQRITEDRLRILRFFRFFGRFGQPPADAEALEACRELAAGVDRLSGERVRQELLAVLAAPRVEAALEPMETTGVLARVVPWPVAREHLARLVAWWPEADPLLRLAALARAGLPGSAAAERLADRLRLSNAEAERLGRLLLQELPETGAAERARRQAIFRLGAALYGDLVRLAAALGRSDRKLAEGCLELARSWAPPAFPITGADLLARDVPPGPEFGRLLEAVRRWWEEEDFTPDRAACLVRLEGLLAGRAAEPAASA